MTVCIAARAGNVVFGTADRMLTSSDVQFEPSAGAKILSFTSSIFMMAAGDAGLQAQIYNSVSAEVVARVKKAPNDWILVHDVVDLYISHYNGVRKKGRRRYLAATVP